MTFTEKKLYHQIHPLKLSTDISASIISLYLFWHHYFLIALILHFLIPIIGSFLIIKYINIEKQKKSALGKYIKKYMTGWMEALRLTGDIITIFGAWYHSFFVITLGIITVLFAWFRGKLIK